jgi:EAL domain-containing protein (putative c-di-GMP-specific phosphodiesterase class I)
MNNIDKAVRILNVFRNQGIRISMDDFGTGFSSLSYLNQLPLDILKIDRAFIKDISHDTENGELAKLIINMPKTLGLGVIAEGIETQYQLDFLRKYQCDEFQGYLSSAPVAADLFEKFLYEKRMEPVV